MSSQGSVITKVYTSDALLPLRGVPVTYFQQGENGAKRLLATRVTGSSGSTAPLYVETPDAARSLTPGSALRPYAALNISVSYPGYDTVVMEDVQVFPGVQTIQGLQLRPTAEGETPQSFTVKEPFQDL